MDTVAKPLHLSFHTAMDIPTKLIHCALLWLGRHRLVASATSAVALATFVWIVWGRSPHDRNDNNSPRGPLPPTRGSQPRSPSGRSKGAGKATGMARTVSWRDEHGKDLEDVIHHPDVFHHDEIQEVHSEDEEDGHDHTAHQRDDERQQNLIPGPKMEAKPPRGFAGTQSPEWGWYVSLTPPQQQYPNPPSQ